MPSPSPRPCRARCAVMTRTDVGVPGIARPPVRRTVCAGDGGCGRRARAAATCRFTSCRCISSRSRRPVACVVGRRFVSRRRSGRRKFSGRSASVASSRHGRRSSSGFPNGGRAATRPVVYCAPCLSGSRGTLITRVAAERVTPEIATGHPGDRPSPGRRKADNACVESTQAWTPSPGCAGASPTKSRRWGRRPLYSDAQTSSFVRTRRITSSVNAVVPWCPPRSAVRTPSATASRVASRIARPAS